MIVDVYALFVDPGVTATDNYYPNVFPVITNLPNMTALGDYTVTYTVTDGAGNTTTVTRLVRVVDRIAPEIELLGANPVKHIRFTPYVDPGVKVVDNYYSNSELQQALETNTSGLNVDRPGLYVVTYQVTDPSGNKSAKVQRYVEVYEFTGIDEETVKNNILIYPNPSTGLLTISNSTKLAISQITVTDILGKTMLTQAVQANETKLDLTLLHKGLYLVLIKDINGYENISKIILE
jgi:hypothetical protein